MDKMKDIHNMLAETIHREISKGLSNCNTRELGEAIDMLKDMSMVMYYATVTEAMENATDSEHVKTMAMKP